MCIFDILGGKKVIYEEKNPSAPPVIDHQVRLCSEGSYNVTKAQSPTVGSKSQTTNNY